MGRCRLDYNMKNPWTQLPSEVPRVLSSDLPTVEAFNDRYADSPKVVIQTQLFPEPFIGDPKAGVYVLALNPGFAPKSDNDWHEDPDFQTIVSNNLNHGTSAFPFYFLNPHLAAVPGAKWWTQRSKTLIADVGVQTLAQGMFCVELFPYHSQSYKPIPKSISSNRLVPSSNYAAHLVYSAIKENKPIIVMRSFVRWCRLVPELESYSNLFRLNSPQNVALSPGNLDDYSQIVRELRTA